MEVAEPAHASSHGPAGRGRHHRGGRSILHRPEENRRGCRRFSDQRWRGGDVHLHGRAARHRRPGLYETHDSRDFVERRDARQLFSAGCLDDDVRDRDDAPVAGAL